MYDAVSFPPALHVTTRRIDDPGSLLEWLAPRHPTAFLRGGDGIIGIGERVSYVHTVGSRVADIAASWRELCAGATIDDDVQVPGTGLVAFGSFAFSDDSDSPSYLTVPSTIIGRRDGVSWLTHLDLDALEPERVPLRDGYRVDLASGAMSEAAYREAVATAVRRIGTGAASKVVLSRDLVGRIPKMADLRPVIARLAAAYPDTFAFAVNGLIGASPETLVRVENGRATARVLAGSAARGTDATSDALAATALATSAKDRAEHDFALASLVDALEPRTSGITTGATFALQLPNLWHLATDLSADLVDGSSALDLVAALHPTAAVAGSPTPAALAMIDELEPFDRGRYAGPVGWVDANGDGEWAVALRCAQFTEHDEVTAYAGAGIVAGSDPDRELAETRLKFLPIIEALG